MGHISLPSNLNVIIGITNYCVILKMVILYDAIKPIQKWVVVFLKKGTTTCFFSKKQKIRIKKQVGYFFKKRIFLNPDYLSIFCVIFPLSHDLVQVTSLSMWLSVRRTLKV